MALWLHFLVLLLALLPLAPILLASTDERASRVFTRAAVTLFGEHVDAKETRESAQSRLRAARIGETYRSYAARSLLTATFCGLSCGIVGVYFTTVLLSLLAPHADAVRSKLPSVPSFLAGISSIVWPWQLKLFALLFVGGAIFAATAGFLAYVLRWYVLDQRSKARGTRIEATLPRTVAFIYALSRSGMAFPQVLDTLAENGPTYGEAAVELGVAVRNMHTFGTDVLTALRDLSADTPSDSMSEFAENLASVLGGGQTISDFMKTQYERYQESAEAQQERHLQLLAALAEGYVTVLVAGPLFMLTTLVVIGLVMQDTLPMIRMLTYVFIPFATLAFVAYVADATKSLTDSKVDVETDGDAAVRSGPSPSHESAVTDGGTVVEDKWSVSRQRLAMYDHVRWVRKWLYAPGEAVLDQPAVTFLVTVPLGLVWVAVRVSTLPSESGALIGTIDAPLAEATLLALGGYAVVYEVRRRRTRAVEAAVPDFLDRFASVNEAGATVIGSVRRVSEGDLGALTLDLERTWRDIQWGADVGTALGRLAVRTRSSAMSRAVTLITNAMQASGDVAPVLRLAANEARANRRLERERRDEMVTYLLVIYISFFVFLGIVVALTVSFIPAIESVQMPETSGSSAGPIGGLGGVDTTAYKTAFFHASLIQALCSGLVAGQLGEGNIRDGAKHASILLALALFLFAVI